MFISPDYNEGLLLCLELEIKEIYVCILEYIEKNVEFYVIKLKIEYLYVRGIRNLGLMDNYINIIAIN